MKTVLGVGAALVDILANVSDEWMESQGVKKGGMNSVDWPQMEKFLKALVNPLRVPGGSTCNTMVGIAKLGGKAAFISKVGRDELGELFQKHLSDSKVESRMGMADAATGCVFSAVTPDAERSMWTFLGASSNLGENDFTPALFDGVGLLFAEGYNAFNTECFKKSFALARSLGVETALDFSSFGVVDACRKTFDELFEDKMIDIVIANEDEAFAWSQGRGCLGSNCQEGQGGCGKARQTRCPDCQGWCGDPGWCRSRKGYRYHGSRRSLGCRIYLWLHERLGYGTCRKIGQCGFQ